MRELDDVAVIVLVLGAAAFAAVFVTRLASIVQIPTAAIFLAAGVALGSIVDAAHDTLGTDEIARLGTFALIFILFYGGFEGGWTRTRTALWPILGMGLVGTLVTTGLLALACHALVGLPWLASTLIAVALAPTDPAAVFSVLGDQEIEGRADIILEGESGANDPVGIALMIGAIEFVQGHGSLGGVVLEFTGELVIGGLLGAGLGWLLGRVLTAAQLGDRTAFALACMSGALVIYGVAALAHGSGFLAVFVAGLVVGNADVQAQATTEDALGIVAGLGETAMFTALGVTVSLAALHGHLWRALAVFALLTFLVRPLVVFALLAPARLTNDERLFVAWGGLKGAVPILLASFTLLAGLEQASVVYTTVFVVVTASIALQGTTLPMLARRLKLLRVP